MLRRALPLTLTALCFTACQGDKKAPSDSKQAPAKAAEPKKAEKPAKAPEPAKPAATAKDGTAKLTGQVIFKGKPPAETVIDMKSDPKCAALSKGAKTRDHRVKDGKLQDVFVYVKSGISGKYPVPKTPVTMDQKGCQYEPKVLGIMAKQEIEIINSDPLLHNIHAYGKNEFNVAMPTQGQRKKKKFKKAAVMVSMKCDVHPWMQSYIGVVKHPFFQVTGEDGAFSIEGLPAGTFTLAAVHPKLGEKTSEVTVADGASAEVSFTFGQ